MKILHRRTSGILWEIPGDSLSRADLSGANLSEANLSEANLSEANLSRANLSWANLSGADLSRADLSGANLSGANLSRANLSWANLSWADLSEANLSGAKGLLDPIAWLQDHFEFDDLGMIVHKVIGNTQFAVPDYWKVEAGAFVSEVVNPLPTVDCACGVNFGTHEWCQKTYPDGNLWRCRIRMKNDDGTFCADLVSVIVPYNTDGKCRCGRLELLEKM